MQIRTKSLVVFGLAVLLLGLAAGAHAEFMQPKSISSNTGPYAGNEYSFAPELLIDGAGILDYNGQTEVTPLSRHMPQGVTPDGDSGNTWMSGPTADASNEYVVFDFEEEVASLSGVYVWPWFDLGTLNRCVKDIDIYVGDGSVLPQTTQADWQSVLTKIDSITVAQAPAPGADIGSQSFTLAAPASDVRYVMFDVRSTYGGDSPTGMYPGLSEVGFEVNPVPEPSTLAIVSLGLFGILPFICGRRSR
ncbi:MAG TPA: hypothetical protein DD670_01900 [Planctomycetaceae bacterium]|nr:hypothetical protein [Planctomycetaceae bacterium]